MLPNWQGPGRQPAAGFLEQNISEPLRHVTVSGPPGPSNTYKTRRPDGHLHKSNVAWPWSWCCSRFLHCSQGSRFCARSRLIGVEEKDGPWWTDGRWHDRIPVSGPSIAQFKRRVDKTFDDLPLGNHIHYRQPKKQFVRNGVVGIWNLKSVWQQGLPSLDYNLSKIIHLELKRLDDLKPQPLTLWLWWKPGRFVEPVALIRKCKVVPFNASFMFLKRLREALREGGASWCYPVTLPPLFFLAPFTPLRLRL